MRNANVDFPDPGVPRTCTTFRFKRSLTRGLTSESFLEILGPSMDRVIEGDGDSGRRLGDSVLNLRTR